MAGKKPAKPMAGQSKTAKLDPAIYGNLVRFVGTKDAGSECVECGRKTIRGMIRLKDAGQEFCSSGCAHAHHRKFAPVED